MLLVLNVITATGDERKDYAEKKGDFVKKEGPERKGADTKTDEHGTNGPTGNTADAVNKEVPDLSGSAEEFDPEHLGYDETSVYVDVQKLGGKEISTVILNNIVYLPITDIFDYLKIKNTITPDKDSVTGFFIDLKAEYFIDKVNNQITYKSKVWKLGPNDLIRTPTNLYLRIDYYNEIFGLDCIFDSYNLSIKLNAAMELPAIMEMKQKQLRGNISKLTGTVKADTTVGRSYPLFHIGMADWSASSMQTGNKQLGMYNLMLGAVVAGGEADVSLNLYSNVPFSERQQSYMWRYANNDNKILRQVIIGKINPLSIATIYAPIVGVQLTNSPTTFRRSFGTYTISDMTQPGWTVELYVNNVLVDYTKADPSGFYSLNVPLVYGSTDVKLRFYGTYGELETKDQHIEVPVSFLPKREMEYTVSSGIVEDGKNSIYSRENIKYGLSRNITVGGGMEYLSSVASGKYIPFVNTSVKLLSNMYFSGDYAYGVRTKGVLNYHLHSNLQIDLDYTSYNKGQSAIIYNFLEERKVIVSSPFHLPGFGGLTRLSFDQILLPGGYKQMVSEWLVSSVFSNVSVNVSTFMYTLNQKSDGASFAPSVYSNMSLSVRMPKGFLLTPQVQYSYYSGQFMDAKLTLNKIMFSKGYMNMTYERNFTSNISTATIGLRYDFSFAKVAVSTSWFQGSAQFSEVASGSLLYDGKTKYLEAANRTAVGKSGITLVPYLDVNGNGKYDEGEPRVPGLQVQTGGGRVKYNEKDTSIQITDLEPYTSYFAELNTDKLDNVSWQIRNKTMRIATDPNNIRMIEIPVSILYEVSGTVFLKSSPSRNERGLGQMKVNIYSKDSAFIASVLTESDGFFNYQGLRPGSYIASLDTTQMRKLNYVATQLYRSINIANNRDGDITDGIDFEVQSIAKDTVKVKPTGKVETHNKSIFVTKKNSYAILVLITNDGTAAKQLKARLIKLFNHPVEIVKTKNDYHFVLTGFEKEKDAEQILLKLEKAGFHHI